MGQGVEIKDGSIVNKNPASGELISLVPCTSADELDVMVENAVAAQPSWEAMDFSKRIALLKAGIQKIASIASPLQDKITQEMGKPLQESIEEVEGAVDKDEFLDILEESLKPKKHGSCLVVRQALGVVAVMSPWNFPADEILFLVLPALGSGNTGE